MKIVNDVEYWDIKEVYTHLNMSRPTFYRETKKKLHEYHFEGRSKPWYARSEVVDLAEGRLEERPRIVIKGLLHNWTNYARELGMQVDTLNCTIDVNVALSPDVCAWIGIPTSTSFVQRRRITFIEGTPITTWVTSYPLSLASPFLDQIKHENDFNVPDALATSKGITAKSAKDDLLAREASVYEQEILQLKRPDPVLELRRATYSELGKLLWYSNMTLLGSWFRPEYSYTVTNW